MGALRALGQAQDRFVEPLVVSLSNHTGASRSAFKMRTRYDAVIVGAGPSGCVLAHDLASRGLRTALIERETLPRYKT